MNWKAAGLCFCLICGALAAVFGGLAAIIWLASVVGPLWAIGIAVGTFLTSASLIVGWSERDRS